MIITITWVDHSYASLNLLHPATGATSQKRRCVTELWKRTPAERRAAMTWAQRPTRVFNIDIATCEQRQGPVRIILCVEDPAVIRRILEHLR